MQKLGKESLFSGGPGLLGVGGLVTLGSGLGSGSERHVWLDGHLARPWVTAPCRSRDPDTEVLEASTEDEESGRSLLFDPATVLSCLDAGGELRGVTPDEHTCRRQWAATMPASVAGSTMQRWARKSLMRMPFLKDQRGGE